MIDGVMIKMGGRDWQVPPINLKSVKALGPKIDALANMTSQFEMIPLVGEIVLHALRRNYPEVTQDEVEDMIDLGNAQSVMEAILFQSGFNKAGEVKATETTDQQIGTSSTVS